jgi:hypothetical protein
MVKSFCQFAVLAPVFRVAGYAVLFCDKGFLMNAGYTASAGICQLSYRMTLDTFIIRYPFPSFMAVAAAFGVIMEVI